MSSPPVAATTTATTTNSPVIAFKPIFKKSPLLFFCAIFLLLSCAATYAIMRYQETHYCASHEVSNMETQVAKLNVVLEEQNIHLNTISKALNACLNYQDAAKNAEVYVDKTN